MNSQILVDKLGFIQRTALGKTAEIEGVYIGDLLSWVMGHAQSNQAWMTMLGHPNIVAVSLLRELACIIVVEDAPIADATIEKADEEEFIIFSTSLTSYEAAKLIATLQV